MKITLAEDNGCMNEDGKPTLVVLEITRNDGKIMRVPYPACHQISQIYMDVRRIIGNAQIEAVSPHPFAQTEIVESSPIVASNNGIIERNDIVECVHVIENDMGIPIPIVLGKKYRVIDIFKEQGQVVGYEVLDDSDTSKGRIGVSPKEVKLFSKFQKTGAKVEFGLQEIIVCPECKTENVISKGADGKYYGPCSKCGKHLEKVLPPAEVKP